MSKPILRLSLVASLFLGGGLFAQQHGEHGGANAHMNRTSFEDLVAGFESAERAAWQKPDEVIAALGDLSGKTVIDIGSGTGYFSFRLVEAGAHVICADVDERFLDYIADRKQELGLSDAQIELRKVPYDSSLLNEAEADLVLIVDTYHHIENREAYFAEVLAGLKPGGQLVVIDFFSRDLPVGPPVGMKLDADTVIEELRAAGFDHFEVDRDLLPYQYIIVAS